MLSNGTRKPDRQARSRSNTLHLLEPSKADARRKRLLSREGCVMYKSSGSRLPRSPQRLAAAGSARIWFTSYSTRANVLGRGMVTNGGLKDGLQFAVAGCPNPGRVQIYIADPRAVFRRIDLLPGLP